MIRNRGVVLGIFLVLAAGSAAWARTPIRPAVELNQLLGPIALYPDPLLAEILPAATAPEDLALAAKFLEDGGDLDQIDAQPWNDNAKALARWTEILRIMNRSRDWTDAVGAAFLDQPEDVMKSIQRLRAVAMNSGALMTTDEQRVTAEDGIIYVYPSDPAVIHLPQYDADKVFALLASSGGDGMVTFGSELLVGYWLHHELDWRKHRLYSYDYREFPYGRRNPWYFAGQVAGQIPPGLPEQENGKWKPYKNKVRPYAELGGPLPKLQVVAAPVAALQKDGTAVPTAESRPLAAPKDLPPPPPVLTPVDPELEPLEEQPVKKPAPPAAKAKKPAASPKAAPAKTVKHESTAPHTSKAKAAEKKSSQTKPVKVKAEAKKKETAPAKSTKDKPADAKPSPKKPSKTKAGKAPKT